MTFRSFVLFAEMRTGSNHLEETLNSVPGLTCHGEVFNPIFVGQEHLTELFGVTLEQRQRDPAGMLAQMRAATHGLSGFRFFHDHDPRVLDRVLPDRSCAKVILTREPVESYVSMRIAEATGLWRITSLAHREPRRIWFDPDAFHSFANGIEQFRADLRRRLRADGQVPFEMTFPDILDTEVLNGLLRFLGIDHRLNAPSSRLKRQNPGALRDKVTNPEVMEQALAARGSAVPADSVRVAADADRHLARVIVTADPALMYVPLPGGPQLAVAAWMRAIGAVAATGEPASALSLLKWLNRTKSRTIFTVVSHPVTRCWRLFLDASGGTAPPEPRAAFLSWLGQAGASAMTQPQCEILAAVAAVLLPDRILRAERLTEELNRIARGNGDHRQDADLAQLAEIYDADVEKAVRLIHTPDYRAFGYRKWNTARR